MLKFTMILVLGFVLSSNVFADPNQFNPDLCGVNYPKQAVDQVTEIPRTPFVRTAPIRDEYWPLVCKGGGATELKSEIMFRPQGDNYNPYVTQNILTFRKSAKPAGARGENLNIGECAWIDRPLNASETPKLVNYTTFSFPKLQITNKYVNGNLEQDIKISPHEYQSVLQSHAIIIFYARATTDGMVTCTICQRRQLGIYPIPYMILR